MKNSETVLQYSLDAIKWSSTNNSFNLIITDKNIVIGFSIIKHLQDLNFGASPLFCKLFPLEIFAPHSYKLFRICQNRFRWMFPGV